jgi:hypothetical protein
VVADCGDGVCELLRRPGQLSESANLCPRDGPELAALATATRRPAETLVGTFCAHRCVLDSPAPDLASLPEYALSGEVPDVRAVCGNAACTDLCGGRSARAVPTAIRQLLAQLSAVLDSGADGTVESIRHCGPAIRRSRYPLSSGNAGFPREATVFDGDRTGCRTGQYDCERPSAKRFAPPSTSAMHWRLTAPEPERCAGGNP